jgi:hypothetical protein
VEEEARASSLQLRIVSGEKTEIEAKANKLESRGNELVARQVRLQEDYDYLKSRNTDDPVSCLNPARRCKADSCRKTTLSLSCSRERDEWYVHPAVHPADSSSMLDCFRRDSTEVSS